MASGGCRTCGLLYTHVYNPAPYYVGIKCGCGWLSFAGDRPDESGPPHR